MNYNDNIFITFDMDWVNDEVFDQTLEIVEKENIKATFFITNYIDDINYLKKNNKYELGLHPNFNRLFDKNNDTSADEILRDIKNIIPKASSLRSHCITQSSALMEKFKVFGVTHKVNTFIPTYSGMYCYPYKDYSGIIKVPYIWGDDCQCLDIKKGFASSWEVGDKLIRKGLKIFNFHPIHVFLNTENIDRYNNCKQYYNDVNELEKNKFNCSEYGTRSFLINLIKEAKSKNMEFKLINEIKI